MDSDLYPSAYFMGGGGSNYVNYGDDPGWSITAQTLKRYDTEGPVLEVGCATGWFVRAAREIGLEAHGVDVSAWAIDNPAPGVGRYLHQGSVLDLYDVLQSRRFPTVVSWEMLEHVPEEQVLPALLSMLDATNAGGLWVHRIALEDAAHDHNAHDDATHFTIKPREWWMGRFNSLGLEHLPGVEESFDRAFEDRDWSGRFFAFRA